MGKLIVTEFMTLDGVAQAPGAPDEDRDAGYWPNAPEEIPFTGLLNRVTKYVATRTLTDPLASECSGAAPCPRRCA